MEDSMKYTERKSGRGQMSEKFNTPSGSVRKMQYSGSSTPGDESSGFRFTSSSNRGNKGRSAELYKTSEYIEIKPEKSEYTKIKPERSVTMYSPAEKEELNFHDVKQDFPSSDYSTESVEDYSSKAYKLSDSFSIVSTDSSEYSTAEKPYRGGSTSQGVDYDTSVTARTQTSPRRSKPMSSNFMYGSLMKGPIRSPVTSSPGANLSQLMTSTERRQKSGIVKQSFDAEYTSPHDVPAEKKSQKSIEKEINAFKESVKSYKKVLSSNEIPKSSTSGKLDRNEFGGTFFNGDLWSDQTEPTRDYDVTSSSDTRQTKEQPISSKVSKDRPITLSDTFVKTILIKPMKKFDIEFVDESKKPSNLSETYIVESEDEKLDKKSATPVGQVDETFVKDVKEASTPPSSVNSDIFCLPRVESLEIHSKNRHRSSGSATSGHSDTNISRLITEEDLVDTIFYSCDPESTGKVTVSALLDYIRMIMLPAQLNESGDIEELGKILDPHGQDEIIDLQTYHIGVTKWIEALQSRSILSCRGEDHTHNSDFSETSSRQTPLESTPVPRWERSHHRQSGSSPKSSQGIHDLSLVSFGSLETMGDDMVTCDNDLVELQNQIEDLQYQVKKLTEQNVKLHAQMETTEDANAALIQDVEDLKNKLKSCHETIQRANSVREENEDLRSAISTLEDNNRDLRIRCTQMEKEKSVVDIRISNLQDELQRATMNLEEIQKDNKHVRLNMEETKKRNQEIEEQVVMKEVELTEKSRKLEELQQMMEEMSRLNKDLKCEKVELENQLLEAKQEIASYHAQKQAQLEDEERNDDKICPEQVISPITTSTPFKRDKHLSLRSELHSLVSADNNLPSPLCGNDLLDDTTSDVASTSAMSMDRYSLIAAQVSSEFQRKKEFVLRQINKLSATDLHDDNLPTPEKLKHDLEENMDFFVDNVKSLTEMKKESDKKAGKLSKEVRQLREENCRIQQKHEEAIRLLHNMSQSEMESSIEIREQLKQSLTGEQVKVQDLRHKLSDAFSELESVREEAKILTTALETQLECRTQLESEIQQLKRSLRESEEKVQDNYNKAAVVGEQLLKSKQQLRKEKRRNKELEETHERELSSILQLLPGERQLPEAESQSSVTGEAVREAVNSELQKLQDLIAEYKQKTVSSFDSDSSYLEKLKNGLKFDYQLTPVIYAKHPPSLLNALTLESLELQRDSAKQILLELAASLSAPNLILPPATPPPQPQQSATTNLLDPNESQRTLNKLNKSCPDLSSHHSEKVNSATQTDSEEDLYPLDADKSLVKEGVSSADTSLSSAYQSASSNGQLSPSNLHPSESQLSIASECSFHTVPSVEKLVIFDVGDSRAVTAEEFVSCQLSPEGVTSTGVIEEDFVETKVVEVEAMSSRHPPLCATKSAVVTESVDSTPHRDSNGNKTTVKQSLPKWQQEILQQHRDENQEKDREKTSKPEEDSLNDDKRKLSASRLKLKAMHEQDKSRTSLTSISIDGKLVDLINGDLEEIELTEADKRFNEQLLEEARKVSQKFQSRKGRSQRSNSLNVPSNEVERSKTPSPTRLTAPVHTLSRAKSFESLDMEQDVKKGDLKPLTWKIPENKNKAVEDEKDKKTDVCEEEKETIDDVEVGKSPERRDSEDLDIKADILKALEPRQKDTDMPVKAKTHQPLSKLWEENKLQKRRDLKFRMPELSEASETESAKEGESADSDTSQAEQTEPKTPESKSEPEEPSSPVTPNLSDNMLHTLGVARKIQKSPGSLSDQEVEAKFQALALAFRTDKFTLEKRLDLQERHRDLAEINVQKELDQLREALQDLNPICVDVRTKDLLDKLKHHVDVVNKTTSRLSSKAEVHGAVQQEGRMNHAVEVMINHVENLKRLYEREKTELEDTKKLLQENRLLRQTTDGDLESRLNKRSMSIAGNKPSLARLNQRKSEFSSSRPPLTSSMTIDSLSQSLNSPATFSECRRSRPPLVYSHSMSAPSSILSASIPSSIAEEPLISSTSRSRFDYMQPSQSFDEDARARFTQAVTSTAIRNRVTGMLSGGRRASAQPDFRSLQERQNGQVDDDDKHQRSVSSPPTPTTTRPRLSLGATPFSLQNGQTSVVSSVDAEKKAAAKKEEEIYQQGYEQGVRSQVSRDLGTLREQQKVFCDNLEELMDTVDGELDEEVEEENAKVWWWPREWERTNKAFKIGTATLVFIAAIFSLIFTLLPVESCDRRNSIPISWTSLSELLWPHTSIRHSAPPPQ
ncbi:putative leucine-rich repeat-containing protein DDB_G0290503 isoform X3 [Ptychodera flava]|uniref:putative leucine-rich repeat-containing protein DDB_G0290503 isoform X3 n=1 Tax=Ptychodera flava TaxID=63121 RepID=UPI00396A0944